MLQNARDVRYQHYEMLGLEGPVLDGIGPLFCLEKERCGDPMNRGAYAVPANQAQVFLFVS